MPFLFELALGDVAVALCFQVRCPATVAPNVFAPKVEKSNLRPWANFVLWEKSYPGLTGNPVRTVSLGQITAIESALSSLGRVFPHRHGSVSKLPS